MPTSSKISSLDSSTRSGPLTRANEIIFKKGDSSVFVLSGYYDQKPPKEFYDGNQNLRRRRGLTFNPDLKRRLAFQNRYRLIQIKLQESTLNWLFRWFLLSEHDEGETNHLHDWPNRRGRKLTRSELILSEAAKSSPDKRFLTIVRHIVKHWLTPVNLVELILILVLTTCCFQQCYEILRDYSEYPSSVRISQVLNDDFRQDLPAITICNRNRISKANLNKNFPQLNITHLLAVGQGTFNSVDNFSVVQDPEVPIEEQLEWPSIWRALTKDKTEDMHKVLPDYSPFKAVTCVNVYGEHLPCSGLKQIESIQRGLSCLTLFHDSILWDSSFSAVKNLEDALAATRVAPQKQPRSGGRKSRSDPSGKSLIMTQDEPDQVSGGLVANGTGAGGSGGAARDSTNQIVSVIESGVEMGNEEIVRMRINFQKQDYADRRLQFGSLISIHSNSHIGFMRHITYGLQPGYWYNFYINRFDYARLPAPYQSKCFDYEANRYVWHDRLEWMTSQRVSINRLASQVVLLSAGGQSPFAFGTSTGANSSNNNKTSAGQPEQEQAQNKQQQVSSNGDARDHWIEEEIAKEYAGTLRNRSLSKVRLASLSVFVGVICSVLHRPVSNEAI